MIKEERIPSHKKKYKKFDFINVIIEVQFLDSGCEASLSSSLTSSQTRFPKSEAPRVALLLYRCLRS